MGIDGAGPMPPLPAPAAQLHCPASLQQQLDVKEMETHLVTVPSPGAPWERPVLGLPGSERQDLTEPPLWGTAEAVWRGDVQAGRWPAGTRQGTVHGRCGSHVGAFLGAQTPEQALTEGPPADHGPLCPWLQLKNCGLPGAMLAMGEMLGPHWKDRG